LIFAAAVSTVISTHDEEFSVYQCLKSFVLAVCPRSFCSRSH